MDESVRVSRIQVVEADKKLSECLLWKLQEEYYATCGLSSWESVPYYPTSNAFIGETYADLILHFLLDVETGLDFNAPLYILELATGSGAFSFYLLKELEAKLAYFEKFKALKLRYVMTDFTASIVKEWQDNPRLKPFRETGLLDFAVFRPEEQTEIRLINSGEILKAGSVRNPVMAIANYFLDSIRQDQFRVSGHQLEEVRLSFMRELEGLYGDSPVKLEQLSKSEAYVPIEGDYYGNPTLNRILADYAAEFEDASILLPIGGFRCIENLLALSGNRLAFMVLDKGFSNPDYMRGHKIQSYAAHDGAFSFMVNFNALTRYFKLRNGTALIDNGNSSVLNMMMGCILPGADTRLEKTRYYFEETIRKKDTVNGVNLVRRLLYPERYGSESRLRGAMSLIQLGNFDPLLLYECTDLILEGMDDSLYVQDYRNLLYTLSRVREGIFVASTRMNVYHSLEKIYFTLRHYGDCLAVALESLERFGDNLPSLVHAAFSLEKEEKPEEALPYYRKAAALDPAHPQVAEALQRLQG